MYKRVQVLAEGTPALASPMKISFPLLSPFPLLPSFPPSLFFPLCPIIPMFPGSPCSLDHRCACDPLVLELSYCTQVSSMSFARMAYSVVYGSGTYIIKTDT